MTRGTLQSFLSLAFVFRPYLYKKIGQKVLIFIKLIMPGVDIVH